MKNTIKNSALLLTVIATLIFTGCNDKNDCKAGTGGNVTLVAKPQHHGATILSTTAHPDTAYLKFDTQEFPGSNPADYDLVVVGEDGEDHVHIEGLKCGDYYIYMTGFDTTISQRVAGGIPYSFSNESGEVVVTVPVVE